MQEPARSESGAAETGRASEDARPTPEMPAAGARLQPDEVEEISLLELANVLLKRWKLVAGLPIVTAFATAIVSLVLPPIYTAAAVFVPESASGGIRLPGGLAGLAAQFGVSVGGGGNSPRFYADVIESRTLRDQVLTAIVPDPRAGASGGARLIDIFDIEGDTELERLENGREVLDEIVGIRYNPETYVVRVEVETGHPQLSADVANVYLDLLNRFNLETRQSTVRERRRFVEERMQEAERELRDAENDLKRFLERNRQFRGSPELTFEHDRLQRQVRIKEEVFTSLRRSYEEARIQEVNDTPVITVIDKAVPPEERSSPRRKLMVVVAMLLGGVLSTTVAFGREFMERARERDEEEYQEFSSRWAAIKAELRSLLVRRRA